VAKRAEDLALGGLMLAAALPCMALVAVAIRVSSPGPAIIRQRRFGYGHRPITVFKFRTMYHDLCDLTGATATTRQDSRVTPLGRLLRATSLDELPQLVNVLLGTMSLVGPRAHPVEMRVEGEYYGQVVQSYPVRHRMKPGITGLAQISGNRGLVDSREKAQARLDYDLYYVEHWSIALDLKILLKTLYKGFLHKNAF
jgi:lipopolysaccharide/colanic/teichoic acid biosynthesis glycosyltransferase